MEEARCYPLRPQLRAATEPEVWLPRRRRVRGWPAPSRRLALQRRPASSRAAARTSGWPRGSHYPHSIRAANDRRRQGFVDVSHTLPGLGTDQSPHGEGRAGVGRTNYGRRARARPPGPAPEPAEVVRRPLHLPCLAPRSLSIAGR